MSLLKDDLKDLIYPIFEIDSYASKMGDDKNIVTLSFSLKNKEPAEDLMHFIETGYNFVLDSDVTAGEQSDGTYKVFVELERDRKVHGHIMEIVDGVKQLSGLDELKFRYYKGFKSVPVNDESIAEQVPTDPDAYGINVTESNLNNFKNFFNRSYLDSIDLLEDELTIKKAYADKLKFLVKDFDDESAISDKVNESFAVNDFAEIIFLTKYIGDYNISKYGNEFHISNSGKTLVVERII